jgi:hypothetical protein
MATKYLQYIADAGLTVAGSTVEPDGSTTFQLANNA